MNLCANLSSEGLDIEQSVTEDIHKTVWVIDIPKHQPKLPVYAHNKAWQRIEDSLVELTPERLNAILPQFGLRSPPFYSGYSPQRFFQPGCRPKIHCFTQVCFRKV